MKMWITAHCVLCLALILAGGTARGAAADWPQYRADAARSGYVKARLPEKLSLHWSYQSRHLPAPAWLAEDTRMPFDRAYQPVIAGGLLYYGSSVDGKVYALDAASGAERWTFFTGGPVRFAPACWNGRVFAASDDGRLYCLDAASGKLLWDRRGGPGDSLVLGNGAMISRWPARGGPVVQDGVVYFSAGIWPSEGIYLYALDAASGKVLWCNDGSGGLVWDQPHKGARARSGVAPQGYLVASKQRIIMPNGRGVPAAFSREAGKLEYFHLRLFAKAGGSSIVATADHFINGGYVFDAANGLSCGKAPKADAAAAAPDKVIFAEKGQLTIYRWVDDTVDQGNGVKKKVKALKAAGEPIAAPHEGNSIILVGESIVLGGPGRVSVMRDSAPAWSAEVDGAVHGLAFAGGCLYASTDQGMLYCFGAEGKQKPLIHRPAPAAAPYGGNAAYAAAAEEIVRKTGITEGYAADLGCGDGALAYELAKRTKLIIQAIDSDPKSVRLAREKLDAAGLYGSRVTVRLGDPGRSNLPNYFAGLVFAGRAVTNHLDAPASEASRLQRPWGGVVCTGGAGTMQASVRGPLEGAGDWTHQYCDAANTAVSTDRLAKSPLAMLWFGDYAGITMASRHGRPPAPLFSEGRLFFEGRDGLHALDAYNGRRLWDFDIPEVLKKYDQEHLLGTAIAGGSFCLEGSAIYARDKDRCYRVDAATGKKLGEIPLPGGTEGKDRRWGYLAVAGGVLFGSTAIEEHIVQWSFKQADMADILSESSSLFAMEPATGQVLWTYRAKHSIRHNAIAVGAGRVYLIDRPMDQNDRLSVQTAAKKKKGRKAETPPPQPPGELIALDARTGEVLWRVSDDVFGTMLALSVERGLLLMSYQRNHAFRLPSERGGRMAALRASDGKRVWDIESDYNERPILNGGTIYATPVALDLLTGEQKDFKLTRSYGCGIVAGSVNLLTFRSGTLGFRDLTRPDSETENYGGIRPRCGINALPAGGLLLQPDATEKCTCGYLNKAFVALQPVDRNFAQ